MKWKTYINIFSDLVSELGAVSFFPSYLDRGLSYMKLSNDRHVWINYIENENRSAIKITRITLVYRENNETRFKEYKKLKELTELKV